LAPLAHARRGWHPLPLSAGIGVTAFVSAWGGYALSTTLPVAVGDLGSDRYLGWTFAVYLSGEVLGICVAAALNRVMRPALVQGLASAALVAGLVIAAIAQDATVLVFGRWIQGVGAGVVLVVVFTLIARCYAPEARPRLIALTSAALIVPGMIGPTVAGAMTSYWGWRSVFLVLVAFTALSAILVIAPIRRLGRGEPWGRSALLGPAVLVFAALTGIEASGLFHSAWGVALLVLSLIAVVPALAQLMPTGALTLQPGVPALVGLRFMLSGAYFGGQIWIPSMLIQVHRLPPERAGLVTLGAPLGWAVGSMWQSRGFSTISQDGRRRRVAAGSLTTAAGMVVLLAATVVDLPLLLLGTLWAAAAAGMGVANSTVTTATLHDATEREAGFLSMAIQLADSVGSALAIGLGTVVREIDLFAGQARASLVVIFAGAAALCVVCAVASRRMSPRSRTVIVPC